MSAAVKAVDLDPDLSDYGKSSGVSGNIISVGSDTLANLMTLWAEEFKKLYPKRQRADSGSRFFDRAAGFDGGNIQLRPHEPQDEE